MIKIVSISLAFIILIALVYYLVVMNNVNTEGWVNYSNGPFNNINTGSGDEELRPIGLYNVPRYRRPYDWPKCHLVDYPIPHCRHNEEF